jgi:hypothetical protein
MKFSAVVAVVALLSGTAVAADCLKGGYCRGSSLGARRCDTCIGKVVCYLPCCFPGYARYSPSAITAQPSC